MQSRTYLTFLNDLTNQLLQQGTKLKKFKLEQVFKIRFNSPR